MLASSSTSSSQPSLAHDQIRVGHLCAILVRNLTLRPTRDRAWQTLTSKRSEAQANSYTTSDDADLTVMLAKSATKRRNSTDTLSRRRSSASWSKTSRHSFDDHFHTLPHLPSQQSPTSSKTGNSRSAFVSEKQSLFRDSSQDEILDPSPRPILKRASSTRDGRDQVCRSDFLSGFSSSATSTSHRLGDLDAAMLSRSDSCSSSRSSRTVRRPDHRPRTTSTTSSGSFRSVRFDSHISSSSDRRPSNRAPPTLSDASRSLLFSDKSLSQIMHERLLECYVELSTVLVSENSPILKRTANLDSFYKTSVSPPGLHHSWGYTGGSPIAPLREFITTHPSFKSPLEESALQIRLWARQPNQAFSKQQPSHEMADWKLVCETIIDLRELKPLSGSLHNPTHVLPPNSVILGVAPGANSLSGKESLQHTRAQVEDPASTSSSLDEAPHHRQNKLTLETQIQAESTRRLAENVVYYTVPLNRGELGSDPGLGDAHSGASNARKHSLSQSMAPASSMDGYASDPELMTGAPLDMEVPAVDVLPLQRKDRQKHFLEEQQRVLELSLRETKMMPSYTLDQARQLAHTQAELRQLHQDVQQREALENEVLSDTSGPIQLQMERNQRQAHLHALSALVAAEKADLERKQADLEARKAHLIARKRALRSCHDLVHTALERQREVTSTNQALQQEKAVLSLQVHAEQAALLRDLETILPIDLSDASTLLFSICGLPMPNAVSSISSQELEDDEKRWKETLKQIPASMSRPIFHPFDDDTISSALGLVAQLVILLSTYLSTPVHYPMAIAGSRAVIQDCISLMSGPRAFPLYARGMERYRYEYAVFLLNKNIEQLMNVHSVTVIDIRHTLPNLKNLMLTVAAAPFTSHTSRKSHIGKHEISLPSTSISRTEADPNLGASAASALATPTEGPQGSQAKPMLNLGLELPFIQNKENGIGPHPTQEADVAEPGKDGLATIRVLGAPKAPPIAQTSGGAAMASVSRALSYFGGGA